MLCEECHENESEVLITEVDSKGNLTEKNLCKACASKKGYFVQKQKPIAEIFSDALKEKQEGEEETYCSTCGTSWSDFKEHGRFGCADCYKSFGDKIEKLITRVQGASRHVGRKAKAASGTSLIFADMELKRLRKELARAIQNEEYEKAARIRDDMKKYENRT